MVVYGIDSVAKAGDGDALFGANPLFHGDAKIVC